MDDRNRDRIELLHALAVTAELTGSEFSEAAARVMADDLEAYPLAQVLGALTRCRRELRGRLALAAIIERLDDGRPGPNEAWAMVPQDEATSVVMTDEIAEAFGVAAPLLRAGQIIAARSAFIESYTAAIAKARSEHRPLRWFPSLGQDPTTRAQALEEAVRKGRLTAGHAHAVLPTPDREQTAATIHALAGPRTPMPEHVKAKLLSFTSRKAKPEE